MPAPDDDFDFALWLQEFGHGATNRQLTNVLKEVVQACRQNGGKGTITLVIQFGARDNLAEASAKVKVSKPMPSLPGGTYWTASDGALVNEDPRQMSIPKKVLEPAAIRPLHTVKKDDAS